MDLIDFVRYCGILYNRSLVSGVGGNLSIRNGDRIFVTPSGYSLNDVSEHNVVEVDIVGNVRGGGIPTKDLQMHLEILRARPQVNCVCHVHGAHIIAVSALMEPGNDSLPPLTPGFVYLAYPLAMLPFFVPGSAGLSSAVREHFNDPSHNSLLLQNHGLITAGRDFQEAFNVAEEIDEAARIWIMTRQRAKIISQDDVRKIKDL